MCLHMHASITSILYTENEKEAGPNRNVFLTSEQRLYIMKLNVGCAFFKPCIAEWS